MLRHVRAKYIITPGSDTDDVMCAVLITAETSPYAMLHAQITKTERLLCSDKVDDKRRKALTGVFSTCRKKSSIFNKKTTKNKLFKAMLAANQLLCGDTLQIPNFTHYNTDIETLAYGAQ